jgi:hypothetical protein
MKYRFQKKVACNFDGLGVVIDTLQQSVRGERGGTRKVGI